VARERNTMITPLGIDELLRERMSCRHHYQKYLFTLNHL
jgi:hypothetical protein